jgi:hypothetical protein
MGAATRKPQRISAAPALCFIAGLLLACTSIWMPLAVAAAQDAPNSMPGSALVASREAETTQLGRLIYRVRFDDGSWTHQQVDVCPAFTHYSFARYTQKTPDSDNPFFLAVYALDSSPARTLGKPWQGGILLLDGGGLRKRKARPLAEQKETMRVFNRIWEDELSRSAKPGTFPTLSWSALADCYANFAGLQPRNIAQDQLSKTTINPKTDPVNGALVLLQSSGPTDLSLTLTFDRSAQITYASINHSAHVN